MAITETALKDAVSMKLNNGTDASGNIKTVSVSIGSLSTASYDNSKAMAVVNAISPCLSKGVYEVRHTKETTLYDGE